MKESAKEQHKVDRANFAAAKAEAKAQFEEAKAMGKPETMKKLRQEQRDAQIKEANEHIAAVQKRIDDAKNKWILSQYPKTLQSMAYVQFGVAWFDTEVPDLT